jgi:hypothetical protein
MAIMQPPKPFVAQQFDVPQWQAPQQIMPQQAPQGLLSRIGSGIKDRVQDQNFMDRLAIGLSGMSMHPNQGLIETSANRIDQRQKLVEQRQKLGLINEQKNRTIEALKNMGTPQAMKALQLLEAGGSIVDATNMAFTDQGQVLTSAEINAKYPNAQVEDGGLYNLKPDGTMSKVGGNGTTINLGDSGVGDFQTQRIKSSVARFDSMLEQAQNASFTSSQVSLLGDYLSEANTGVASGLKQKLYEGLGLDLRSDTQVAAEAMLSKLVPAQREKGSGPMSDRDLDMFRNALPSLKTTPEGNALIVATLQAVSEYQIQLGRIVDDVYADPQFISDPNKLMTEIARRQREMVDPLISFKKSRLTNGNSNGARVINIERQ